MRAADTLTVGRIGVAPWRHGGRSWYAGVVCFAVLATVSCGGGGDGEPLAASPSSVGADVRVTETTTSTTPAPADATAPGASPAEVEGASSTTVPVANRSEVLHEESGLRLILVVADKLVFAADEPILLELVVENTASAVRYVDSTQKRVVALFAEDDLTTPAWTNGPCRSADVEEVETGALALEPGEQVRYVHRYPYGDADTGASGEHSDCRVPPGPYVAAGRIEWCPEESLRPRTRPGDRPICDEGRTVAVNSAPLRLTIEA